MSLQMSTPRIKTNEYEHEVLERRDRTITVGIAAVSEHGRYSKIATAQVFVPGTEVSSPADVQPTAVEGSKIKVRWAYKDAEQKLLGFRLFQGETMVADEKTLGPDARAISTEGKPSERGPEQKHFFVK